MTPRTKKSLLTYGALASALLACWMLLTAAAHFVAAAIGVADRHYVPRDTFVVYQQAQSVKDSLKGRADARRDSVLSRLDARVGAMYCGSLPPDKRAGCQ